MIIDCDSCAVRELECHDCVVSVLLGTPSFARTAPGGGAELDPDVDRDLYPDPDQDLDLDGREQAAIAVLAGSGLVPPLRLVPRDTVRGARPDLADPGAAPTRRAAAG